MYEVVDVAKNYIWFEGVSEVLTEVIDDDPCLIRLMSLFQIHLYLYNLYKCFTVIVDPTYISVVFLT